MSVWIDEPYLSPDIFKISGIYYNIKNRFEFCEWPTPLFEKHCQILSGQGRGELQFIGEFIG